MSKQNKKSVVSYKAVQGMIFLIRGQKVMLDVNLARLYGVETRRLNEQVRRNVKRFPEDFIFRLSKKEFEILKSQIATSSWGGRRKLPLVFTEHGVAMLSSILNSDRAIQVNISIMRAFTQLRQLISDERQVILLLCPAYINRRGKKSISMRLI